MLVTAHFVPVLCESSRLRSGTGERLTGRIPFVKAKPKPV